MKTITAIVCVLLLAFPTRPRAQLAPAICIVVVTALATTGIVIMVSSCKPKYFVIHDEENNLKYCKITTRREANLEGLKIVAGPFKDAQQCDRAAHPTNLLAMATAMVTIEKSTDLINWTVAGQTPGTIDCFEWDYTNSVSGACFFRVRE